MTGTNDMSLNLEIEHPHTFHALYIAVYEAHAAAPSIWTDTECNRILTSIMAAKPFSWRVVGITPTALSQFASQQFRYISRKGMTRAHLKPRIETVRFLLKRHQPLLLDEFIKFWLANDRTVICAQGENKAEIPAFIPIEHDDGRLFSCAGKLAGWHHRRAERDVLKKLYELRDSLPTMKS